MSEKKPPQGIEQTKSSGDDASENTNDTPLRRFFALQDDATVQDIRKAVNEVVSHQAMQSSLYSQYSVLVLYDPANMQRADADKIYSAVAEFKEKKDILMVLRSDGGSIEAAYFIAKLCRDFAKKKFVVAVPRRAKSAATLICCGADEIHMGSLSELGPIDPQIGNMPALALKNAVEHIADLAQRYPGSSQMFASYLERSVKPEQLGYYERVAESAVQYAVRLLKSRVNSGGRPSSEIATRLVYEYKDHGFAIDVQEALDIFGDGVISRTTNEYQFANDLYQVLDLVEYWLGTHLNYHFYFTGSLSAGCNVFKKKQKP